jgi:hypothetical protein
MLMEGVQCNCELGDALDMDKRLQHWEFEEPAAFAGTEEKILANSREVREQMDECIRGWLKELATSLPGSDPGPDIVKS